MWERIGSRRCHLWDGAGTGASLGAERGLALLHVRPHWTPSPVSAVPQLWNAVSEV